jgi:PAS domain S-box-containing protein
MDMMSVVFIAFVGLTMVIAGLYFYLFARSQERFIQYWGLCWVFYSLSLLFLILGENLSENNLFEIRKVFDVLNILFILFGVYSFSNRRIPGYWVRFTLYLIIWVVIAVIYNFEIMAIYIPLSMFQMVISSVICFVIFTYWELHGFQKWMAMVVFLFWGYGKAIASLYEGQFSEVSNLYLGEIIFSNILNFIIFIVYLERASGRLSFAEKIFKTMAENASDIIFVYSLKPYPNFSYVTPSVEGILGYTPQDFYGDSRFYLNIVETSNIDEIQSFFNPELEVEVLKPQPLLIQMIHKNGEMLWGELRRTIIYENGSPTAIEGILRDVTIMKKTEEQLMQSKNSRKQLLSYISHELKTPVTSIIGYATALRDGTLTTDEEREMALETVFRKSLTLENLIMDLFQLSKLETKQLSFDFIMISASELSNNLVQRYGLDIRNSGLQLTLARDHKELEKAMVIVDIQRMGQVFNNIIQNAIRFSKLGDVIKIKFYLSPSKDKFCFSISDKGPGIPNEDLEQIFERFYKSNQSITQEDTGNSGLGLTISKEIVEAHQGTVTVKSSLNRGSTFVVAIPLYQE